MLNNYANLKVTDFPTVLFISLPWRRTRWGVTFTKVNPQRVYFHWYLIQFRVKFFTPIMCMILLSHPQVSGYCPGPAKVFFSKFLKMFEISSQFFLYLTDFTLLYIQFLHLLQVYRKAMEKNPISRQME